MLMVHGRLWNKHLFCVALWLFALVGMNDGREEKAVGKACKDQFGALFSHPSLVFLVPNSHQFLPIYLPGMVADANNPCLLEHQQFSG